MKKTLSLLLLLMVVLHGQVFETELILNNGPSDKRINLVVLGDGYTAQQQDDFIASANNLIDYLFTKEPFASYRNYFNVYAIKVISEESGLKHPGTATDVNEPVFPVSNPNNYLGTTFDVGVHRCVFSNNTNITTQVLAANTPFYDAAFVLGNSPEYGGCGGQYAYLSNHQNAREILVHELGHSFSNLADEYWFAPTGESKNKTQDNNPETNRWRNWIGVNGVDIYPFQEDPSWFRPHQSCEMRLLNNNFCSVCVEATIERIHDLQSSIETYLPESLTIESTQLPLNFTTTVIEPIPNTLSMNWMLNGQEINTTDTTVNLTADDLVEGVNTLTYSVVDDTPLVRTDNHETIHINTVTWTINANLSTINVESLSSQFKVYPNPVENKLFLKSDQFNTNEKITFEIYDLTGKMVLKPKGTKVDSKTYLINLNSLMTQNYIVRVIKDGKILLNHKIIKSL